MSGGVGPGGEGGPTPSGEPLLTGAAVEPVDVTVVVPIADPGGMEGAAAGVAVGAPTATSGPGADNPGTLDPAASAGVGAVAWSAAEGTPGAAAASPIADAPADAWRVAGAVDTAAGPAPDRQVVAAPPGASPEAPGIAPGGDRSPAGAPAGHPGGAFAGHAAGAAAFPDTVVHAAFPATGAAPLPQAPAPDPTAGHPLDGIRPSTTDLPPAAEGLATTPAPGPDLAAAALAGGLAGPSALSPLLVTALSAMTAGARRRGGPLPRGGPAAVDADVRTALGTAGVGDLPADGAATSAAVATAAAHPDGIADAPHPHAFATRPHPSAVDPTPQLPVPHPHAAPDASSAHGHPADRRIAEPLPARGIGAHQALAVLTEALAHGTADPADPRCAGHLHCPPLAVAVAADAVAAALNPSLDSWDQAPAATALETEVVAALAGLAGFDPAVASGTVTTGGTESNLLGLLLARDRSGPGVGRHRVLCSDAAHFSVRRSAVLLGLGDDAVVPVATGLDHRIDPGALDAVCRRVAAANDLPTAIVATAGTTDFGAVDPLAACADVAREHGAWLHVDAAYGGGALFSDRLAPLLHGLDRADSVGLDLHKLGWQPVAAGVFLVRDRRLFAPLTQRAKYLNPADDEDAGFPSLLGHSPRTTRRADVFKIAVTLRALGRTGLGALVDRCHELARYAGERIDRDPGPGALELTAEPVLTTVVFRYVPEPCLGESPAARSDTVNAELRRRLLAEGRAVVGRTDVGPGPGSVRLKLTLLNPHAAEHDVDAVLRAVIDAGRAVEREL